MLVWRVSVGGMRGLSIVLMLSSNQRADMLGRLMSSAYSSTLMHQVLRSRVRRRRKLIGSILYFSTQSTRNRLSLALCSTMLLIVSQDT